MAPPTGWRSSATSSATKTTWAIWTSGLRHAQGITSVQMDIKIQGLSREVMARALAGPRGAAVHPRQDGAVHRRAEQGAVEVRAAHLHPAGQADRIRDIIGPGGKMIRAIVETDWRGHRRRGRRHGQHRFADGPSAQKAIDIVRA